MMTSLIPRNLNNMMFAMTMMKYSLKRLLGIWALIWRIQIKSGQVEKLGHLSGKYKLSNDEMSKYKTSLTQVVIIIKILNLGGLPHATKKTMFELVYQIQRTRILRIYLKYHHQIIAMILINDKTIGLPAYSHPPYSHQVGICHNE